MAFLSSECIFLPIFGGGLVVGQPSRAFAGGAKPSSLTLLTGAKLFSCPQEFERAPGTPLGMDAELPGKGVKALFFLLVPKRRILSQMFL